MPTITWSRTVVAVAAVIVAYLGATTAGNAIENRQLDGERRALQREIAAYQTQHDQLTGIRSYFKSDEYIQTIARRELGLTMPGEPLVIVVSPERPLTTADDNGSAWWQKLLRP